MKLQGARPMAGRPRPAGVLRPVSTQRGMAPRAGPGVQTAPPTVEEDPRVKCKDCGAFGHKAASPRCPIRCWQGALAPQALGSLQGKENRNPWYGHLARKPQTDSRTVREVARALRQEQQRGALPQKPPRSTPGPSQGGRAAAAPWEDARHPSRPLPVHPTQKQGPGPDLPWGRPRASSQKTRSGVQGCPSGRPAPGGFSPAALREMQGGAPSRGPPSLDTPRGVAQHQALAPGPHPWTHPNLLEVPSASDPQPALKWGLQGSSVSPEAPGKRAAPSPAPQKPPKKARLGPAQHPQEDSEDADVGPEPTLPPPPGLPDHGSCTALLATQGAPAPAPSAEPPRPAHGPERPDSRPCSPPRPALTLVLSRRQHGQWSCRFKAACPPPPPPQSTPTRSSPEGAAPPAPRSVLHEDLLVSSSSEDSDGH